MFSINKLYHSDQNKFMDKEWTTILTCNIPEPGGVLKLFFDGVCSPRSETPTHV